MTPNDVKMMWQLTPRMDVLPATRAHTELQQKEMKLSSRHANGDDTISPLKDVKTIARSHDGNKT